MVFVYLMKNEKELSLPLVEAHVAHLKELDRKGLLILCGPFADYPGGMVVFRADGPEQAESIASSDPFISSGCKSYELRRLEVACRENNYLL